MAAPPEAPGLAPVGVVAQDGEAALGQVHADLVPTDSFVAEPIPDEFCVFLVG